MSQMAQPPTGDEPDEEPPEVALNVEDSSGGIRFQVYLKDAARAASIPLGNYVEIALDAQGETPMVMLGNIGPEKPDVAGSKVRRVATDDGCVNLPKELLRGNADDAQRGLSLGLDADHYDADNRLIFGVLALDGIIALEPLRYEDGTDYDPEDPGPPATGDDVDESAVADPVETTTPEDATSVATQADAPIPTDAVVRAARSEDVDRERLEDALDTLQHVLETSDEPPGDEKASVGGNTVAFVETADWAPDGPLAELLEDKDSVGTDADLVAALRRAHELTATDVFREADRLDLLGELSQRSVLIRSDVDE
jgi:hypothetical protein